MTTTTNTAQGLLTDILEHPEADDLRLIYADYLQDHDEEERADLIRWMVGQGDVRARFVHRLTPNHYLTCYCGHPLEGNPHREHYPGKPGSWACAMRVAMVGTAEIPDEPPFGIEEEFEIFFRRGFVAEVHAPLAVLQQHLPALVRQHPIERVRATDKEPYGTSSESIAEGEFGIAWHRRSRFSEGAEEGDELPDDLYECLPSERENDEGWGKYYPTIEAAHAALSDALLTLARR